MEVFVDTSAIYALLSQSDPRHGDAVDGLTALQRADATLVSSSFVLHETVSLLQARLGVGAVRRFSARVAPHLEAVWIDQELYARALSTLLSTESRKVSLTDWTSFEVMRERRIDHAFAFDDDFERQGFELIGR